MSIPSKFDPFFPIRRTGSSDNERAQLNKLLRLIIGELDISQDTSLEEAIEELQKKIEAVESGDNASVIWGQVLGSIENQEDLWNELQSKVENLDGVDSFQADVIASRPIAGNDGAWFLATDERKLYRDDGANWQLHLSIDHTDLENVGTNTHDQIDSHIADASIHFSDLSGFDTDDLSEGITNLYFTEARASDAAPVQSVDGLTGAVDLSGSYEIKRQNNLTATTDPTVNDDNTQGYEPLSRWINTSTGEIWLCISAATGAAKWDQATLTLDELGSAALVDVGTGGSQVPTNADLNIGNWDTAFGWGSGGNQWSGVHTFLTGDLRIRQADLAGNFAASLTNNRTWTFPDASGTVILDADVGTAAYEDTTTSPTDTTAGRVTRVGDFGIGAAAPRPTDYDSIPQAGGFYWPSSSTGGPNSTTNALFRTWLGGDSFIDIAGRKDQGLYWRGALGGTVGSWQELYHTGNLESAEPTWAGQHLFRKDVRVLEANPGLWLEESDGSFGALLVLDAGLLQVQRRATSFGAFEANPIRLNMSAPSASLNMDGDGNVGIGITPPSEKLEVDGQIKFTGKGGTLDYDEDTVEVGGDFNTGSEVKCVRSGSEIVISGLSAWTHASGSFRSSSAGVIPAQYRPPTTDASNVFLTSGSRIGTVYISTAGTLSVEYRDWAGTATAATSTNHPPVAFYNV